MLFLGTTFFSGAHTMEPPATNISPITEISLTNGTFDHLYVGKNVNEEVVVTNNEWTEDTLLSAPFDENLDAGNSGFSLRNTDTVIIKRREKGTVDWITIFVKPIKYIEDFKFIFFDRYAKGNTDYEYILCSTCNGIENSYVIKEVYSQFHGFFVVDSNNSYGTFFNVDGGDTQRNAAGEVVPLLNNKYAKVVRNNSTSYDTGTASGVFIKTNRIGEDSCSMDLPGSNKFRSDIMDFLMNRNNSTSYDTGTASGVFIKTNRIGEDSCSMDLPGSNKFRSDIMDFLMNGRPKILKWDDGRIWLISVTGSPTDSRVDHELVREISFQFAEIGDCNDPRTLYLNGLSTVESKWW